MKTNINNKNTVMNPSLPREYRSAMHNNRKSNGDKSMHTASKPIGILRKSFCAFLSAVFLLSSTAVQAGKITTYIHTDHLGNPVAKTNSLGRVIERQSYSPDGEAYQHADSDGPGYTGHRFDAATNLVYMQARYYDPVAGRFLSVDPVEYDMGGELHFNRYWYANGNPYLYTDPDGEMALVAVAAFAAVLLVAAAMSAPQTQKATAQAITKGAENFKGNVELISGLIFNEEGVVEDGGEGSKEGGVKIGDKISDQLGERGWTEEEVQEITQTEPTGTSTDNTGGKSESATVYGTKDGGHVVVNDGSKEVVQVSNKNDPNWAPDDRIQWNGD